MEAVATALGADRGKYRLEFVFSEGRLVEMWPKPKLPKATRGELDLVVVPRPVE
jgi:hypothetical protein